MVPLCSVVFASLCSLVKYASFKLRSFFLPFTDSRYFEIAAQCIYGLGTHTIQPHRFLEGLAIVFGAGIYLAHHIHHFSQRDTAAIIAHGNRFAF